MTAGGKRKSEVVTAHDADVVQPDNAVFSGRFVATDFFEKLVEEPLPRRKVTVVCAPTGYGKTTLLDALCRHHESAGHRCLWVALDERDTRAEDLLVHLERQVNVDKRSMDAIQAAHQGGVTLAERCQAIVARLDSLGRNHSPLLLFVDNINTCTDAQLREVLDMLVFETCGDVYCIFSSTTALPFSRTRAKLESLIREIGYPELAFSGAEIRELLGPELCSRLPEGSLENLAHQTEGWPTAVRLVQIILSEAVNPQAALEEFSGADVDLAQFLNLKVLGGFEGQRRRFLLELSLLRRFSNELAAAATGEAQAGDYIRELIERNLFVIPLDRNNRVYRLHGLLREFLLAEARRQLPAGRAEEVRGAAAQWLERHGHCGQAVETALESGSAMLAADMLERVAATAVRDRGDLGRYIDWVERLGEIGGEAGWETSFWYIWALVFHRRYAFARTRLKVLMERMTDTESARVAPTLTQGLQRRIGVLQVVLDTYTDHLEAAGEGAGSWLPGHADDDPFDAATVACAAAISDAAEYRLTAARRRLREASSSIEQSGSEYGSGWVALLTTLPLLHEGEFLRAHEQLTAASKNFRTKLGPAAGIVGSLGLLAAKASTERGLDNEARVYLDRGLRTLRTHGLLDTALLGLDAALKLWRDGKDDPHTLQELRDHAGAYPPRLSVMFSCLLVRRLVRLGRLEEAQAEAARIGLPMEGPSPRQVFHGVEMNSVTFALVAATRIDLDIADGHFGRAKNRITKQTRQARKNGCGGRLTELALDEAAISVYTRKAGDGHRHLARAVSLAAKRDYLRPFLDRAELVAGLVNDTRMKDWGFVTEEEQTFFGRICKQLPLTNSALLEQFDELNIAPNLSAPPTARELELLRLLETGLTNKQLADRLSLSVATVKWHLYNLYTKLGVSNRASALARARALNLLVH